MPEREISLQGVCFGRSIKIVHSGLIAEDKDVAGMAEQTPRIKTVPGWRLCIP
jgi:hypothetical protein